MVQVDEADPEIEDEDDEPIEPAVGIDGVWVSPQAVLDDRGVFLPSPAEIRQACQEIQATWLPWQERERRTTQPRPLELDRPLKFHGD